MGKTQTTSVRQRLADATALEHNALHTHPWISRLAHPELEFSEYTKILTAYCKFFCKIEATRKDLNVFEHLSLRDQIAAMEHDLMIMDIATPSAPIHHEELHGNTPLAVLGALYVLHGAGFGARTLNQNVRRTLPKAPRTYLSLGTASLVWRDLISALERTEGKCLEQQILFNGAARTFKVFGQSVTQSCNCSVALGPRTNMHYGVSPT